MNPKALFTSLANAFAGLADLLDDVPTSPEQAAGAEAPPKRGRPAGSKNVAPAAAPEPEKPAAAPAGPTGKTYPELQALIKPLITANPPRSTEVQAVIKKFAPNLTELANKPEHHAAFEQEIEMLSL